MVRTPAHPERHALNKAISEIMDRVYKLKDDEGKEFSFVFDEPIPKEDLPEYYKVIKKPKAYKNIRNTLKQNKYAYPQEFVTDMAQITWNCRFFNENTTPYYRWAVILDDYIKDTIVPELRNSSFDQHELVHYPDLGVLPNVPGGVSASVEPSSSAATPTGISTVASPSAAPSAVASAAVTPAPEDASAYGTPEAAALVEEFSRSPSAAGGAGHSGETPVPENFAPHAARKPVASPPYRAAQQTSSRHPVLPNYNPAAYEVRNEPADQPNVYNPPRAPTGSSNRQLLEQWVKRGRPPIVDKPHEQRIKSIMRGLKKIKVNGKTIIAVFDKLPSQLDHPEFYKMIDEPISMLDIKGLIKQRYYKSVDAYMTDVFRLIANGKKYYKAVGDDFSLRNIGLLESNITRLYHAEMQKPDSDYIGDVQSSKIPLSHIVYEGRTYKVGNWVMMKNPNDATRPIPAQIFRIWQEHGKQYLNVCWYYRPEWSTHRFDRLFLENEVLKTGQYRDHAVEDIVGPCYIAYFTRWLKGDPGVKYEGPLFICEFRYNDRELNFAKIRTWKACLPDEVRHIEDPIFPLDQPRVLKKYPSPIKHLLPPGSTPKTPIPPPTIMNLNAPPLVGGIYVKRDDEEDEINYFDEDLRQDNYKLLIPPAISFHPGSTTGGGLDGQDGSPQQAGYSPPKATNVQFSVGGLGGYDGSGNGIVGTGAGSDLPAYALQLQHQQIGGGPGGLGGAGAVNSPYGQDRYGGHGGGHGNGHGHGHGLGGNNVGGGHKVIHTPFNSMSYQWSPYMQASYSHTFVQPMNRERQLQRFARENYDTVDEASFAEFARNVTRHKYLEAGGSKEDTFVSPETLAKDRELGEPGPLVWYKAPPEYVANRILSSGLDMEPELNPAVKRRKGPVGLKAVKLGHSAKYLAWKQAQAKAQKEAQKEAEAISL